MKLTTYRLDQSSVLLVGLPQGLDPNDAAMDGFLAALRCLGVSVAAVAPGVELTILAGPGNPVEIARFSGARSWGER